jgi:hypothetical protein
VRVDVAKVAGQCRVRQLGERAGHLDAGRSGADQDKGQEALAYCPVRHGLGLFKGEQYAAADQGRIVNRFEAGRQCRPVIVAEIGVLRSGRQDQMIVALGCPKADLDPPRCRVDPDHLVEQYRGVLLVAQHDLDRFGNIDRRQCRGRDLVKEWLEEVIIVAVHH